MKKIVIAPYQIHKNLLAKYREKDPFANVKIISKEELIREFYGDVKGKAIPYLMKKYGYSYDNSISLIPFLPFVNIDIYDLLKIKNDLIENHLITKNEYLNQFFKDNEVEIYGYSKRDIELTNIFDSLFIKYRFVVNPNKETYGNVSIYETVFDEVFYTLNKIADLISKGTDINKIYIYSVGEQYIYLLNKFSSSFGFKLGDKSRTSLFSTAIGQKFLLNYKNSKDLELARKAIEDCDDQDLLDDFLKAIDSATDNEMSFETQYDYFVGELKATKVGIKQYSNVVRVIEKPIFDESAHIFVLGFVQGQFPKTKKDSDLLSDIYKKKIGMNTSLEEINISEDIYRDFFNSPNHFYYSYSERSLSEQYFPSPWIKSFKLKEIREELPLVIYSQNMVDYYFAKALDLEKYYSVLVADYNALKEKSDIPYGKYDNSFSGVSALDENVKMRYSYSSINTYYQCPFSYYLGNILEIDPFEGNFQTKFGNIAHRILELHNNPDFDFDKAYDEESAKYEFLPEELPLLENLKPQVKRASDAIKLHQRFMNNPKILTERKVVFDLGKNATVTGFIDKSIILDDKYLVIVDYKTGSDSFDSKHIEEGISLQLPTYCLLAKKDPELKEKEIIGVFINNIIESKLKYVDSPDMLIDPFYRLNGKVVADIEKVSYLDKTICDGKSEFIKGVSLLKKGGFKDSSNLASKDEFDYYAETALRKFLEADKNIRENNFKINPYYKDDNTNACKYCEYKDICFVRAYQRRYLKDENSEETEGSDNE